MQRRPAWHAQCSSRSALLSPAQAHRSMVQPAAQVRTTPRYSICTSKPAARWVAERHTQQASPAAATATVALHCHSCGLRTGQECTFLQACRAPHLLCKMPRQQQHNLEGEGQQAAHIVHRLLLRASWEDRQAALSLATNNNARPWCAPQHPQQWHSNSRLHTPKSWRIPCPSHPATLKQQQVSL